MSRGQKQRTKKRPHKGGRKRGIEKPVVDVASDMRSLAALYQLVRCSITADRRAVNTEFGLKVLSALTKNETGGVRKGSVKFGQCICRICCGSLSCWRRLDARWQRMKGNPVGPQSRRQGLR